MELSQAEQYNPTIIIPRNHTQTTTTFSRQTPTGVKNSISIAAFYDIHLGHHRTLTPHILKGFDKIFRDDAYLSSLDMIVIPGDLFDRNLPLVDNYLHDIIIFFGELFHVANKFDIVVRILEGTPGHDWKQTRLGQYLLSIAKVGIDFKYVETLSIEFIESLGITMLYVPDEWSTDVTDTYNQTLQLLRDRGLEQVDFCLFHGAFNYQINEKLNPKAHSEELWSQLVKYYIFAGHVHIHSQWKNILVGGSFDRLAHGEEQDKGWITLRILPNGEHQITFTENVNATKYVTVDVRNLSKEETLSKVDDVVNTLPDGSHVRLQVTDNDEIRDGLKTLKQRHPLIFFTLKSEKKVKQQKTLTLVENQIQAINLNRENIERIIDGKLSQLDNIDKEKVLQCLAKYL